MIILRTFYQRISSLGKLLMAEKIWTKPKHREVLIYDACGAEVFLEYLEVDRVELLHVRLEKLNMYILAKCILSGTLNFLNYVNEYITAVHPRLVITFIQNSHRFYELKKNHKDIKFVSAQNGLEDKGFFSNLRTRDPDLRYKVDYMLVFGKSIGVEYQKYMTGTAIPVGSIKNNMTAKITQIPHRNICFISQYREVKSLNINSRTTISFEEFYAPERMILRFLGRYVREKGLRLCVAGCGIGLGKEQQFFADRILSDFDFCERVGNLDSYKLLDDCEVVVGVDSALVYESLAKAHKTAIFSIRNHFVENESFRFGWPEQFPDKGPFWTNVPEETHFREILDYLFRVEQEEWEKVVKHYTKNLIEYDYGNTRFLNLMKELDVPTKNPMSLESCNMSTR